MDYITARKLIVDAYLGADNPFIREEPEISTRASFEDMIRDTIPEVVRGLKHLIGEKA